MKLIHNSRNLFFRAWYYLREGWVNYTAFILSAINTIIVTYYLAIERFDSLKEIFPTIFQYAAILSIPAIPIMIYIGYLHWKTNAKTAEIDIAFETNPYQLRTIVNSEMILNLNLKLQKFLNKINEEKLNEDDKNELKKLQDEFNEFVATRKFRNYDDWKYFKKIDKF